MKHKTYQTDGVCSRTIEFDITTDNKIINVHFQGGCEGNLKAISKLVEGKDAVEISEILKGNTCKSRPTSCADQLASAIMAALNEN